MDKDVFLAILSENYERMKFYIIGGTKTAMEIKKEIGIVEYKENGKYHYISATGNNSSVTLPHHPYMTAEWHIHPSPKMERPYLKLPYEKAIVQEERKVMPSNAYFSDADLRSVYRTKVFQMLSFWNETPNKYLSKTGWYLRGLPYEYANEQLFIYDEAEKYIKDWWDAEKIKVREAIKQKRFNELAEKYNVPYNTNHTKFVEELEVKLLVAYNIKAMQYHYEHSLFNDFIYIGEV